MNNKSSIILLSLVVLISLSAISAAEVDDTANNNNNVANDQSYATSQEATTSVADNSVSSSASAHESTVASTSDTKDVSTSSATNDITKTSKDVSASAPAKEVTTKDTTATSTQKEVSTNAVDTNKNIKTAVDTDSSIQTLENTQKEITNTTDMTDFQVAKGDTLNFVGNFNDFSYTVNETVTINGVDATFYNSTITLGTGSDNSIIGNLTITNTNSANALVVEPGVENLTIDNNIISVSSDTKALYGISLDTSDNSVITNNKVTVSAFVEPINYIYSSDWSIYEGRVLTYGIGVFSSSNILVENNTVDVSNSVPSTDYYSTLTGIAVQGSPVNGVSISNITIKGNKVNVKSDQYAYGITLQYDVNDGIITENTVDGLDNTGIYICGIQASDSTINTIISDNLVNVNATEDTYGINVIGSLGTYNHDVTVYNNNINVYGDRIRGIELYFVNNITVDNNNITAIGNYANGIGLGAVETSTISNNLIITEGQYFDMYPQGWYEGQDGDEIGFITGGIYITSAENWMDENATCDSFGNDIIGNYIYTNGVYTVNGTGYDNLVTENYLASNVDNETIYNSLSVGLNNEENMILNNYDYYFEENYYSPEKNPINKKSGDATFFPYLLRNH